ncbi:tail fiber assembly protein, partial [Escherichia coli]|nr:tail fiber assembly protein [Escherichia coli]
MLAIVTIKYVIDNSQPSCCPNRYATAPAVTATKISVTNPNKLPDWRPSRTSIRNVPIPPITESRSAIATGANSCVSSTSSLLRCQEVMVCKVTSQPVMQRQQAEKEKQSLLQLVRDKTQLWDSQLRLGIISVQGKQKLTEWILYAQKVEST